MAPGPSEATAAAALVAAWDAYFAESSVNGIPATPGAYSAGSAAMLGALTGMSAPGGGAAAIAAGVTAFWGAIASLPTPIWITAPIVLVPPIVPPPGLGGMVGALTAAFAANTASKAPLPAAAATIAAAMHGSGGVGATVPGSVPPAPPAPLPIL
jgi:hypothetical protein